MDWLHFLGKTDVHGPDGPGPGHGVRLEEAALMARINGWHAELDYSLTYSNQDGAAALTDARFVFPVEEGAAIWRLLAHLPDGRIIECECRERSEARAAYADAVASGRFAALATEAAGGASDLMQCCLGNLPPGGRVRIELGLLAELETPGPGALRLTIPRGMVPRYGAPAGTDDGAPAPLGSLSFRGSARGLPGPLRGLRCSRGGQLLWQPGQPEFTVAGLSDTAQSDLELDLEFEPPISGALVTREAAASADAATTAAFFCREVVAFCGFLDQAAFEKVRESAAGLEFVLVVDRSGSMGGDKIQAARDALLLYLKSLPPSCSFNVVGFGSGFSTLFDRSETYGEDSLARALKLQAAMQADMGGTELEAPLRWVFERRDPARMLRVALLTDGAVSNPDNVTDLVRSHCGSNGDSRLSAIGIGHGASTALVRGAARAGRGRDDFVRDGEPERLRDAVVAQLKAAATLSADPVRLSAVTEDGRPALAFSVPPEPRLTASGQLRCHLLLTPEAAGRPVRVSAVATFAGGVELAVGGAEVAAAAPAEMEAAEAEGRRLLLHRAAARAQLRDWVDANVDGKRTREIVKLSVAANVASPCTAFVGIDRATRSPVPAAVADGRLREEEGRHVQIQGYTAIGQASVFAQPQNLCRQRAGASAARCSPNVYDPTIEDGAVASLRAMAVSLSDELSCQNRQLSGMSKMFAAAPPKSRGSIGLGSVMSFFRRSSAKDSASPVATSRISAPPPPPPPASASRMLHSAPPPPPQLPPPPAPLAAASRNSALSPPPLAAASRISALPPPPPQPQAASADPLMRAAAAQGFDGRWEASEEVAQLLGVSTDEISRSAPSGASPAAWATALVVAHLMLRLGRQRSQWELMQDKALAFIRASGANPDSLLSAAKALIGRRCQGN